MTPPFSFRSITDNDKPFLSMLYASTREEELRPVPWSDAEKKNFLQMQFDAQHTHYQAHYPDARFEIILIDNVPIGRLYQETWPSQIRVIDIALLPEFRGKGMGQQLMQGVMDQATKIGKAVSIHVEHNNPAMRLYKRLGFQKIGDKGVYFLMEWKEEN